MTILKIFISTLIAIKVIPTKYHKGYMKALEDVEREIRNRFGFAERENVVSYFFNAGLESRDNG